MTPEETIHKNVCTYISRFYPHVLFNTDLSGIKLTMGQAKKIKTLRSSRAWPDIFIPEPRGKYSGLYIELKADGVAIFTKEGELCSFKKKKYKKFKGVSICIGESDHIKEQYEMILKLRERKFFATFAIGFDEARNVIDKYLNL